jgi:hypothetical protein
MGFNQNIGRLDIPVNDTLPVRVIQGVQNTSEDSYGLCRAEKTPRRQWVPLHPFDYTGKRQTSHQLHCKEQETLSFANFIYRNNVGMRQDSRGFGLLLEKLG